MHDFTSRGALLVFWFWAKVLLMSCWKTQSRDGVSHSTRKDAITWCRKLHINTSNLFLLLSRCLFPLKMAWHAVSATVCADGWVEIRRTACADGLLHSKSECHFTAPRRKHHACISAQVNDSYSNRTSFICLRRCVTISQWVIPISCTQMCNYRSYIYVRVVHWSHDRLSFQCWQCVFSR